jgi:hypothetical protein
MHSRHAAGVDKHLEKQKDKGGKDQQGEVWKPKQNQKKEGGILEKQEEPWRKKRQSRVVRSPETVEADWAPARKLVIVTPSPQCGTHATEGMKVGALIGGSHNSREEVGRGGGRM